SEWSTVSGNLLGLLQGSKINYPAWSIARRLFLPECGHRIRVMPGREYEWFDSNSREAFFTTSYLVSADSNRMACVLEGPAIKLMPDLQMISTAVTPGTLQVPGNGQPIILLSDAQTTGGYPRIAQVAAVDLPLCGQLRPGDSVMFTQITWDEAERLYFA